MKIKSKGQLFFECVAWANLDDDVRELWEESAKSGWTTGVKSIEMYNALVDWFDAHPGTDTWQGSAQDYVREFARVLSSGLNAQNAGKAMSEIVLGGYGFVRRVADGRKYSFHRENFQERM